jgi:hypothetical protein
MYCNAQIMAVTGHKSVQALSMYQRVDDEDKIRMGKTLTGCNLFIYFSKDITGQHSEPGVSGIMPAVISLSVPL